MCVACKPGFGAAFHTLGAVTSCTLISHCIEPVFNGCLVCENGYALNYNTSTKVIDYNGCHEASDNCFAGYISSESKFVCAVCETGYILNADNMCDTVFLPNCDVKGYIIGIYGQSIYANQRDPIEYMLTKRPMGCDRCATDYISAYDDSEIKRYVCVQNDHVKKHGVTSSYYYVNNCNYSYYNTTYTKIRCKECLPPCRRKRQVSVQHHIAISRSSGRRMRDL